MNQQTNRESPENEDENLAITMAEFLGWKEYPKKSIYYKKFLKNLRGSNYPKSKLKHYFFDPDSEQPNPRGFLMVMDKLDEKFDFPTVTFFRHSQHYAKREKIVCSINPNGEGIGPTRYHAFYSAVKELMDGS